MMDKINQQTDESILVCVYYGPNGERLIRRGCKIAAMSHCPLYILTVDPLPFDELDAEKSDYISCWQQLAREYGVKEFILKDNEKRPVAKVIAEVVREKHITQVVIGQTAQSRWEEISKGSFINVLLRELPFVDLHIVSVARTLRYQEERFEKGVRSYLIKDGSGYRLSFEHTQDTAYEGIFFKELGTDFNNGVFKFMNDNVMMHVHVCDDSVPELKNIRFSDIKSRPSR